MKNKKREQKKIVKTKFLKFLQWSKVVARFLAVCSTIAGTVAAIASSSAATTGLALGAAGATSYAATKLPSGRGYEKIQHIAPTRVIRSTNDVEKSRIDYSMWSDEKKQLKKAYSDTAA